MSHGPERLACGAHGALSATHLATLTQLLSGDGRALVDVLRGGPVLRCSLERHTGDHMDLVHDGGAGAALWARWSDAGGPDALVVLPDCPATDGGGAGCGQYLSHAGGHTWEVTDPGPP
ncbi:hypothetical protein [Streptomyces xanthophaeus]|uniref:hypothetical protein n=1 Tax=Streptomyces xanthophaeus TaxID=67385 RepID=UPI0037163F57